MAHDSDPFFIGWSNSIEPSLLRFLAIISVLFAAGLGLLGYGLSIGADDPANGLLRIGESTAQDKTIRPEEFVGEQVFRGYLETKGYSLLHVAADVAHPRGRVLLLSGDGKRGPATDGVTGQVEVRGGILRRGSIEMLVVQGNVKSLSSEDMQTKTPSPRLLRESLGRWRIAGEICDGKCYVGAMSPGNGLSHKACANLCLYGDVPPIFVTAAPVDGHSFLIIAGPDKGFLYGLISDLVAVPVEMEGDVERVGNVLILRIDFTKTRRL